ncbi:hypothetical protein Fot_35469 [Forsythia ovata]|uniref:Uncharacterized protein n=1 Tax=Forsythia ovata TaxID=205694 RepID=A0ABD1SLL5_9LAMI
MEETHRQTLLFCLLLLPIMVVRSDQWQGRHYFPTSKHQNPSQALIQPRIHPQELRENHRNWKEKSRNQIPHEIRFQNSQVVFSIPQPAAPPSCLVPVTALTPSSLPSPPRVAPPYPTYWICCPKTPKITTFLKFALPLTIFSPNAELQPPLPPPNHGGPFSMARTSSFPNENSTLSDLMELFGWRFVLNGKDVIIVLVGSGADKEACFSTILVYNWYQYSP